MSTNSEAGNMSDTISKVDLLIKCYQFDDGEPMVADLAASYVLLIERTQDVIAEVMREELSEKQYELLDALFDVAGSHLPKLSTPVKVRDYE